MIDRTSL